MGTAIAIVLAVVAGVLIIRVGIAMLRSMGTPLPPPPPAKMTHATAELPEPPRHCQEDMDLVTPVE